MEHQSKARESDQRASRQRSLRTSSRHFSTTRVRGIDPDRFGDTKICASKFVRQTVLALFGNGFESTSPV
jgi:hypothetical protein